jgi:C-8 sterol isomerase
MGYIFEPEVLREIARGALGQPIAQVIAQIGTELEQRYPGHILPKREWIFNNAGGAMGAMMLLHGSITEYVMIFGTAVGTEGATGRFPADDYFIMLEGEHWSFAEGDLERHVVKPGDWAILKRGQSKAYRIPNGGWALEYARGAIPLMLPFGLADTLSSTLDLRQVGRTMAVYTKAVVGNLMRGKV